MGPKKRKGKGRKEARRQKRPRITSQETDTETNEAGAGVATMQDPATMAGGTSGSIVQHGSNINGQYKVDNGSHGHFGNEFHIHQTADRCLADRCLADLRITDPRHDKKRIEDTKGGLLPESYVWVLNNRDFRQWRDNDDQRLLWVKGDPGKGKTMLLCGIIDHLETTRTNERFLSYFFCQATNKDLNTATAVLRGLIFMLLDQDVSLVSYIKKYDTAGKALFEDANAWQALSEIFTNMLHDKKLQDVFLVIDALDECVEGLLQLLNLIVETSQLTRATWLVSSRNRPDIEEQLCNVAYRLSLEVNAQSVVAAVDSYITRKVSDLTKRKGYRDNTAEDVCQYLSSSADNTFLWVALVCEELGKAFAWEAVRVAKSFPPGLGPLYQRMMEQISESRYAALCYRILALVATAYRPLSFAESTVFIEEWQGTLSNVQPLYDMTSLCGSFLTVRDETIYFVHQSAKDFLMKERSGILFPKSQPVIHGQIFSKSIDAMSQTLKRDIYGLQHLCFAVDVPRQVPNPDPLAAIRYACIHWVNHLIDATKSTDRDDSIRDNEAVDRFLRGKGLYWIESLSLLRGMSEGMLGLERLGRHLQDQLGAAGLQAIVKDAYRLLQTFRPALDRRPLQAYASALVFSPTRSLIRGLFAHEKPQWVECRTELVEQWSACEATLEGHTSFVWSAAFSGDGRRVVSASYDKTVKLWDAATGACKATLEGHTSSVTSAAFSGDGQRVVSASDDETVKLWDAATGACEATLEGHTSFVWSAAFSGDGRRVVSASDDKTVKLWDAVTGACEATLEGHTNYVSSAAFSGDGRRVVSASGDHTVKLWDAATGACEATLEGHTNYVTSAAFSGDGRRVVSASYDKTVKLWDAATGACEATLEGHTNYVTSAATLEGHTSYVRSAAFSGDGRRVVSASYDKTVKLWDAATGACEATLEGHRGPVTSAAFSGDGQRVVSASHDRTVKLWDAATGKCEATLAGHTHWVRSAVFSGDGRRVVSASWDHTVKLWDAATGACLRTYDVAPTSTVAFDPTGIRIHTDKGAIAIDEARLGEGGTHLLEPTPASAPAPAPAPQNVFGLSADGAWILDKLHPVLWLPPEYRPNTSAVFATERGTRLVLGCSSGRVYLFQLSPF